MDFMEDIEVVVGTYENHLLGYKIVADPVNERLMLETSFTDDSHRGALRCVAISSTGILASSSTDDSIRIHSLKKRKEIGGLFEHNGTVNSMVFYDSNHMFSASEDGTISLWKTKNWEVMRTLKGHKSHVMAVAVHPSGKLGLSVGSDRSFFTWDLLTGKLAFQRKLQDVAHNIFFTPSGDHYVLVFNRKIEVCSLADTKTVKEVPTQWRINAVCHVKDNIFAVGGDDRLALIVDVLTGEQQFNVDAAKSAEDDFNSRVRCMSVVDFNANKYLILSTASGDIKVLCLDFNKNTAKTLFFDQAKVRITAMAVYASSKSIGSGASKQKNSQVLDTKEQIPETPDSESKNFSDSDDGDEGREDPVSETGGSEAKKRKVQKNLTNSEPARKKKKKFQENCEIQVSKSKTTKDEILPPRKSKKKLKAKRIDK